VPDVFMPYTVPKRPGFHLTRSAISYFHAEQTVPQRRPMDVKLFLYVNRTYTNCSSSGANQELVGSQSLL